MHPVLLDLGFFKLHSFGFFLALAVLAAMKIVDLEAARRGWNRDQLKRLVAYDFLAALIGSRVVLVLTLVGKPGVNVWEAAFNPRAGFVYYGGMIGAWAFAAWYLRRHRLPLWPITDAFTLGMVAGMAIGRLGCFTGGCCYGHPTDLPWGVTMVYEAGLGLLHPVQLYDSFLLALLFAFLWRRRRKKKFEGELTAIFLMAYAVLRYVTEMFRGDSIRGVLVEGFLSTSQAIGIPVLALGAYLYWHLSKTKSKKA